MDKNTPQPAEQPKAAPASIASTNTAKSPGSKKPHKALWIVLVVLLLAVGGLLVWKFVLKKKSTPTQTATTEVKKDIEHINYATTGGVFTQGYPVKTGAADTIAYNYQQQIYEGLVQYRNITDIKPELATSWTNPDNTTWLFNIKPDVKFHDGNTMTSDDVKYSLDTVKKLEAYDAYTDTLKSVEVVSPSQVKVTTTVPDTLFLAKLTYLNIIDSKAPKNATDADKGTGPYNVKTGTTPTTDKLELAAFDKYHDGHVYTRNLTMYNDNKLEDPLKGEQAVVDNVIAGKSDIGGYLIYDSTVEKSKTNNLNLFPVRDINVRYLGLNTTDKNSPLSKKTVREAIYTAIDVPTVIKDIGSSEVADPATQFVTQDIPGYDPSLTHPAGDAAKAKQMLAAAGYPNGFTLTITAGLSADVVGALAKQLKLAGITVKDSEVDDFDKFYNDIFSGNLQSWFVSYGPNILDGSDTFKTILQAPTYKNAEIDALIKKSDETLNTEERLKTLQEISRKSMEDFASIPLYTRKNIYIIKPKYEMTQDVANGDLGVYFWKVYQK